MATVTREQRIDALKTANIRRAERAALLRRMYEMPAAKSHLFAADALEDVPDALRTLRLGLFLNRVRWQEPRTGTRRATPSKRGQARRYNDRFMELAGLNELHRLGDLTARQRAALAGALRFAAGQER